MKRHLVILAVLLLLALPIIVGAEEETVIPPEMNWSAYPPARETVDSEVVQLMEFLVKKGVITLPDLSTLVQPETDMPAGEGHEITLEPNASYWTSP